MNIKIVFLRRETIMRKVFAVLVIIVVTVFLACCYGVTNTEVTITNQSSLTLYDVRWNGMLFYTGYSYDSNKKDNYFYYLLPGSRAIKNSDDGSRSEYFPGSGYVFF
jgi:hypothetical protein